MSSIENAVTNSFMLGERDYIRRELDIFFSTLPSVADGLKTELELKEKGSSNLR